jgi:hypothetical protein
MLAVKSTLLTLVVFIGVFLAGLMITDDAKAHGVRYCGHGTYTALFGDRYHTMRFVSHWWNPNVGAHMHSFDVWHGRDTYGGYQGRFSSYC